MASQVEVDPQETREWLEALDAVVSIVLLAPAAQASSRVVPIATATSFTGRPAAYNMSARRSWFPSFGAAAWLTAANASFVGRLPYCWPRAAHSIARTNSSADSLLGMNALAP